MMLFPRLAFILSNYFARCNNARKQNEDEEKENRVQSRQHGCSQLQGHGGKSSGKKYRKRTTMTR